MSDASEEVYHSSAQENDRVGPVHASHVTETENSTLHLITLVDFSLPETRRSSLVRWRRTGGDRIHEQSVSEYAEEV